MKSLWGSILSGLTATAVALTTSWVSGQVGLTDAGSMTSSLGSDSIPLAAGPARTAQMPLAAGLSAIPQDLGYMGQGPANYGPPMSQPLPPPWAIQQASYGPPAPVPQGPAMPMNPGFQGDYYGDMPGAYAPPFPGEGGFNADCKGCSDGSCGGACGGRGCAACGGAGCQLCIRGPKGPGLLGRALQCLLPYGEGGPCAPRWYDVTADALYLERDEISNTINFSSDGIAGDILLSTDDLAFQEELGLRLTAACQIFAGSNLELTYFGLFDWSDSAVNRPAQFPDDVFSVMSNFGTDPFGGFDETDRAAQHSIAYSSSIDNFELNVRKRFTGPNCRVQFSWLAGVRYVYLLEDFEYFTLGGDDDPITPGLQTRGTMDYDIRARNSLTGFQLGGDIWTTLVPGVRLGADWKAGLYGNYANQTTNIVATTTQPANVSTVTENINGNDLAAIGEANLMVIYRLNPHWTVRAGWTILYMDGVALAPENFNSTPPNILTTGAGFSFPPRNPTINDDGQALYYGGFAGLEWMW